MRGAVALALLLIHANEENPRALALIVTSWALCLVGEFAYQRTSGRSFDLSEPAPELADEA